MELYPRHSAPLLAEALQFSPVVLIQGPRQCGRTTFARGECEPLGYSYTNFDNPVARESAQLDPLGFVDGLPERAILDEVQKAPAVFDGLKIAVDRDPKPGRFVLTGSSNLALMPAINESLAGRMQTIRLHPLSRAELARQTGVSFLPALFGGGFGTSPVPRLEEDLAEIVTSGGYPPALARSGRQRWLWHRDYVQQVTQWDVRDLSKARSLSVVPALLEAAVTDRTALELGRSVIGVPGARQHCGLLRERPPAPIPPRAPPSLAH